jgi:hypothetical protein
MVPPVTIPVSAVPHVPGFWHARTVTHLSPFLNILNGKYGSDTTSLDFASAPDVSRSIISTWVSKHTVNNSNGFLPAGSVTSSTIAVFANTAFFKADWAAAFDTAQTTPRSFTRGNGNGLICGNSPISVRRPTVFLFCPGQRNENDPLYETRARSQCKGLIDNWRVEAHWQLYSKGRARAVLRNDKKISNVKDKIVDLKSMR